MGNAKLVIADEEDLRSLIRTEVQRAFELGGKAPEAKDQAPENRFSQRQAALRFGISEPTLIRWRKEGKLPLDEVNGRIYYTNSYLEEAFSKSKKAKP